MPETSAREIWVNRGGLVPYRAAFEQQKTLEGARLAGRVPDVLLLLEHPPVYTRGRRKEAGELPMGEEWYRAQGIDVVDTDRGGRITYHGPGQLVGYPIMSLRPYRDDVHQYVRRMEAAIIASLADIGIVAGPIDGLTGVWTHEPRKIASIGDPRQPWHHDPRFRDQRQQRPAAVRVDRALRNRELPHDFSRARAARRVRHAALHGHRAARVRRCVRARCRSRPTT